MVHNYNLDLQPSHIEDLEPPPRIENDHFDDRKHIYGMTLKF